MSNINTDVVIDDARRWSAVQQRDRSVERLFVYAVKTTGIYCRVGCSSRLPRRENVAFFENTVQARAAGFRPCKRCHPDAVEPQAEAARRAALGNLCHALINSAAFLYVD